jgi:spore coat protein H
MAASRATAALSTFPRRRAASRRRRGILRPRRAMRRPLLRLLHATACLGMLAGALPAQPAPAAAGPDPARAFFASPQVLAIRVTLDEPARQRLRERPREYVPATVRLGEQECTGAAVKLKGAAGSFRELDDRPCLTVHLGKHGGTGRLHGLQRFHLNNSVQDDTLACEWLGHDVFTAAGLPAPRVAHARVSIDDRDVGVYVLREAFDRQFLLRAFGTSAGNLYDGGFCRDVDELLEKDAGDGVDDHADLLRLATACRGVDANRAQALLEVVDVPQLVDFLALEALLGHWDGYGQTRNNYRLWLPAAGKAVFLPHGMDQLLGEADASVLAHPVAIVASAVLQQPAFRKRYRERLKALLPLLAPPRVLPRLERLQAVLQRELRVGDAGSAAAHTQAMRSLAQRVRERHAELLRQIDAPEPQPLPLAPGKPFPVKGWHPAANTDGIELDRKASGAAPSLRLACAGRGDAPREGAWRVPVLLAAGRYELRASVRCEQLVPVGDGDGGVRLHVDGAASPWHSSAAGAQGWRALVCAFEIDRFQRTVELECQLRATGGRAWVRLDSLCLARVP